MTLLKRLLTELAKRALAVKRFFGVMYDTTGKTFQPQFGQQHLINKQPAGIKRRWFAHIETASLKFKMPRLFEMNE